MLLPVLKPNKSHPSSTTSTSALTHQELKFLSFQLHSSLICSTSLVVTAFPYPCYSSPPLYVLRGSVSKPPRPFFLPFSPQHHHHIHLTPPPPGVVHLNFRKHGYETTSQEEGKEGKTKLQVSQFLPRHSAIFTFFGGVFF